LDDLQLGDLPGALGGGEDHPVGARHAHLAPARLHGHGLALGHGLSILHSRLGNLLPAVGVARLAPGGALRLGCWSRRGSRRRGGGGAARNGRMAKNMSAGPVPGSARAWALLTLGIVLAVGLAAATPADAAPYTGALKGRFFV